MYTGCYEALTEKLSKKILSNWSEFEFQVTFCSSPIPRFQIYVHLQEKYVLILYVIYGNETYIQISSVS